MCSQPRFPSRMRSCIISPKLLRRPRNVSAAFWFFTFCSSRRPTGSVFNFSSSA